MIEWTLVFHLIINNHYRVDRIPVKDEWECQMQGAMLMGTQVDGNTWRPLRVFCEAHQVNKREGKPVPLKEKT